MAVAIPVENVIVYDGVSPYNPPVNTKIEKYVPSSEEHYGVGDFRISEGKYKKAETPFLPLNVIEQHERLLAQIQELQNKVKAIESTQ